MPDPAFCQSSHLCTTVRAYTVTFRSRTGYEWVEGLCRRDASVRTDQVRAGGGTLVAIEEIPQAPAHPERLGLAAVAPAASAEKPIRVSRRRKAARP